MNTDTRLEFIAEANMALSGLNEIYDIKYGMSAESGLIQRHTGLQGWLSSLVGWC